MKFRSTLLLLLLTFGVGAYICFFESQRLSTKQAFDQSQFVARIDRDQTDSISIKNSETRIELKKQPNGLWSLEEPVKDRADSMTMSQLFTTAETLRHLAIVGDPSKGATKAQLKDFGLSNSETRIKFGGPKPVELLVGKDAAVDGKVYLKVEDSPVVYVTTNEIKNLITKKADDFRDHRLSELNPAQVSKVTIKTSAGEIEFEKKNEHWSVIKPLKARGNDSRIGDLIAQALTARIDKFVANTNLAAAGLEEPRAIVTFYSESAKGPVVLQIGTNPTESKEKTQTYATLSTRGSIVLVPKAIEQLLEIKPNDIRDRNLVRFEPDIVDRITIEAGKQKLLLGRKGESWAIKGEKEFPANASAALNLLTNLKSQGVIDFVADVASDLPKYGLDQPQTRVTLSSFASENTSETQAGEKPIVTILFGKAEGNTVYAKLDDEPFIVSVSRPILDDFSPDPIVWQPVTIFNSKPEAITSIEITKAGQPPISLEREKEKWKLAKGDGKVNQSNAQSLINTLSTLRAIRWLGPSLADYGMEKPAITIKFTLSGQSEPTVLTLGTPIDQVVVPAHTSGLEGVFDLSRPDRSVFDLPLVDRPTTTPLPTPTEPAPSEAPKP